MDDRDLLDAGGGGAADIALRHRNFAFYQMFLADSRLRPMTVLCVGADAGPPAGFWAAYFPNAAIWLIEPAAEPKNDAARRTRTERADPSRPGDLIAVGTRRGPFDVIVDPGSPADIDRVRIFRCLFGFLRPGGFYIAENLAAAAASEADRTSGPGLLAYVNRLGSYLVADPMPEASQEPDAFLRAYARRLDLVAFGPGLCLIGRSSAGG